MKFGINDARDACYGCASALSYWVFRCRDKNKTPAMGTNTWTYFESSIQNSAEISTTIEDYVQNLSNKLVSHLRPKDLIWIVQPSEKIVRLNDVGEVLELNIDQDLSLYSWQNMIKKIEPDGFSEWDVLELCRTKSSIIQVLCRLRFEQDRALGKETVEDFIEVEVN
jgi:hypothetical protein